LSPDVFLNFDRLKALGHKYILRAHPAVGNTLFVRVLAKSIQSPQGLTQRKPAQPTNAKRECAECQRNDKKNASPFTMGKG
jgi:hypothetical protein